MLASVINFVNSHESNYSKSYKAHCVNGYFAFERRPYCAARLEAMPSAQAGILIDEYSETPAVLLQSYETISARLTADGWLTVECLCSATTRRHVSAFLRQFCPEIGYYTAKEIYSSGKAYNVITGEIKEAA